MPHDFPQANKIDVFRHSPADINILKEVLVWDRKEEALGTLPPIHTHTHTCFLFGDLYNKQYINYFQITKITNNKKFLTTYC